MPQVLTGSDFYTVMFYPHEIDIYRRLAEMRFFPKRQAGVVNQLVAKKLEGVENEMLGILGEAAVAEFVGARIHSDASLYGDGGVSDLEVNGKTIQVKTSWHRHGGLLFMNRFKFKADVAVLSVTNKKLDGLVKVVGWTTRQQFMERAVDRDLGYGPCAYFEQHWLYPIHSLTNYLEGV